MQASYTKNYLKIYFWQILSIVLNLLSLFIVVPKLTSQPEIYGVYSVCIAASIFLSYADLGFVNAGFKYASECYARSDKAGELKTTGFTAFILLIFVLIFAIVVTAISIHPAWLIKDIDSIPARAKIASQLLLILAVFSPNIILQRGLQIIFGVRLEDYLLQGTLIVVSLTKITSVYYFFGNGRHEIVQYFLFSQAALTLGLISAFYIAKRKYGVSIWRFFRSVRFSKSIYIEIKSLAYSSLFLTISWILYYELSIYAIAKLAGADEVAYYSIGLTCLTFFRSIFGALFNPFSARFNHFTAQNDEIALRNFYSAILKVMLPVVVFPVLSIVFLSRPFVLSWVGEGFTDSIRVVQILSLVNILGFISYPTSVLLVARKRISSIYFLAGIQPVIFWTGIAICFPFQGYIAFAYFTLAAFLISGIIYTIISARFLQLNWLLFFRKFILPAIPAIVPLIILTMTAAQYLPTNKSKLNLIMVVLTGGTISLFAIIIYYLTAPDFKNYVHKLLNNFKLFQIKKS